MGSVFALFAGLVHPQARQPSALRLRHQSFIASKLVLGALALGGAPVFVAARGVPNFAEAMIFALALAQVTAAMLVVRSGRLAPGQVVAELGLAGIALAAAPATGGLLCTGCWLMAASTEAILSGSAGFRGLALVASVGACALAAAAGSLAGSGDAGSLLFAAAAGAPILLAAMRADLILRTTETALSAVEDRLRALIEVSDAALIALDATGAVVGLPSASTAPLDFAALAGRGLFEHVQVSDRPAFLKLVSDAAHGIGVHVATLRLRRDPEAARPGEASFHRHVAVEMRAKRDPSGSGVVAVLRDVSTMHRQAEREADEGHRAAEAVRSRDDFLATMSHELRTPLNAIIGFSDMLSSQTLRPDDPEKQRDYARIILQSGQHLLSVVNAILDMSKIQSGTFALVPERFAVAPLVNQCREMMELKAEAGLVAVTCDMPADLEPLVADRRACRQILINLLSNAVKFTPEHGRVTIGACVESGALCLSVADTGIGIAAADVAKLGQPFFQVNGSIRRSYEGTGLGLSVVRGLVELHGGLLAIDSVPGGGTTVNVRLPLHGQAASGLRPEPCDEPSGSPRGATLAFLPQRRATPDSRMRRRA